MSDSATFSWIGTIVGDWNTPANWADITTDQTPAVVIPGILDNVIINNGTLGGVGDAATLTFTGTSDVLGNLNTGTLVVGGNGSPSSTLDIVAGATVSATVATDADTISVSGSAAALLIDRMLQIGTPSSPGVVSATGGALIQTGTLVLDSRSANQVIVDGSSIIEIGSAGTAAVGAITVDPDQRLSGSGSTIGNLVDNGLVSSGSLILGQPLVYAGGHGSSSFSGSEFTSLLSGTGVIEVEAGGVITLQEPVTTPGLTFRLDGTAILDIEAAISAGNTIDLSGQSNTLAIDDQWYLVQHPAAQVGESPFYTGGPPTVDATIKGFGSSDVVKFLDDAFLGITITAASYTDGILTLLNGSTDVAAFSLTGDYGGKTFLVGAPTNSEQLITVACFAAGTRIRTAAGEMAVEDLHEDDSIIVLRADGPSKEKVKWVGHRCVDLTRHPRPDLAAPIRIRRGAFGPTPHRDLLLSPEHCLFIDGKLVPATLLINDMTIVQERGRASIHYFHIELDQHGILFAEGLPAESYLDTGNRATFANAGLALLLHPEFQVNSSLRTWQTDACAPLAVDAVTLEPIWERLGDRAKQLGYTTRQVTTDTEPNLHAIVAGKQISPICRNGNRYVFDLPAGATRVLLSSHAARPADIERGLGDRRLLGVAVRTVTRRVGEEVTVFPADHLPAGTGWYGHEDSAGGRWRWTNGAGELLFESLAKASLLEIWLSGSTRYIVQEMIFPNAVGRFTA